DRDPSSRLVVADAAAADRGRPGHRCPGTAGRVGQRRLRARRLVPQGRGGHRDRPAQVRGLHPAGDGADPGGRALRRLRIGHPRVAGPPPHPGHRAGPPPHRPRAVRRRRRQARHLQPLVRVGCRL
ncbi:MAG: FIG00821051: hypothetical protein, partial [uncultured Blastococcus sp.]